MRRNICRTMLLGVRPSGRTLFLSGECCDMAVCLIGHREVADRDRVYSCLFATVEKLIREGHSRFLLGSRSDFNSMEVSILKELKIKYPQIERVYVRAEYPDVSDAYRAFLLRSYEDTYYPESLRSSGRLCYVERNQILIDESTICIFYCDTSHALVRKRKSGTRIAYDYATKRGKQIINLCAT